MSLFSSKKSRNRPFLRKVVQLLEESDGEEKKDSIVQEGEQAEGGSEQTSNGGPWTTVTTVSGVKEKAPTAGRTLLSFEDDLEGDVEEFKVKKSSHSRRMTKQKEKIRKDGQMSKDEAPQSHKLQSQQQAHRVIHYSSDEEEQDEPQFSLAHRLSEGYIPDANMIYAARKKREIARQLGGTGESSSVMLFNSAKSSSSSSKTAKGKSRLIREDENDKSDEGSGGEDDEGPAMMFGQKKEQSRQMQVLNAMENAESGSDEERFIEEQINKGVKSSIPVSDPSSSFNPQHVSSLPSIDQSFLYGSSAYPGPSDPGAPPPPLPPYNQFVPTSYAGYQQQQQQFQRPSLLPSSDDGTGNTSLVAGVGGSGYGGVSQQMSRLKIPDKLVPITVESLKSRLGNRLRDLKETYHSHSQRLERLESDMETAEKEVVRLEEHSDSVSVDYQFYQQMRGYIRDLLSCLTEKIPQIEKHEKSLYDVLKQRADLLVERRRQDVKDEADECTGGSGVKGGEQARQLRAVEREGRRRRRREKRGIGGPSHYEGQSSDDEMLKTNSDKFSAEIDKILSQSREVFSDVVDDFSKLSSIKEHFEGWKFNFSSSYEQAYISLCLPKVFAPFVRLQLLQWNPLDPNYSCQLEDMVWFQVLMFFGFREGQEVDPADDDLQLIPNLVDLVVIPKLTALLQHVWDPLSSSQTLKFVSLVKGLMEDFPTVSMEHKNTQALLKAAVLKLRQTIDNDIFIPLIVTKQLENTSSPRYLFYQRQFWSCVKLFGNITQWSGLIAPEILQELVLDGLLNRYLMLSLQNSPVSHLSVTKVQAIVSLIPTSWYKDGSIVTKPLQGLVRFLVYLAEQLHRAAAGQPDVERKNTRSYIQRIVKLLVRVGAKSEARSLAKEHNLSN